jgi:hypothetical protein
VSENQPLPLLLIDVDGVISLFDFDRIRGVVEMIDGIPHHLSLEAAAALNAVAPRFECVWCTGWEERAEEHLPRLLGLPGGWPHLEFDDLAQGPGHSTLGHWKLAAIDAFAGRDRALAWIDDAHDEACRRWAADRPGRTLLLGTDPREGLTARHADELIAWATG